MIETTSPSFTVMVVSELSIAGTPYTSAAAAQAITKETTAINTSFELLYFSIFLPRLSSMIICLFMESAVPAGSS